MADDPQPKKQPNTKSKPSTLSLTLGYCICVGSVGAKLPQIMQILRAGSAAGLSIYMPLMEVLGCKPFSSLHPRL